MSNLLNNIIRFGKKTEYVRHEAHFNVSARDAFNICQDYAAFFSVMLADQSTEPNPEWIKLGPGEVGGQIYIRARRIN